MLTKLTLTSDSVLAGVDSKALQDPLGRQRAYLACRSESGARGRSAFHLGLTYRTGSPTVQKPQIANKTKQNRLGSPTPKDLKNPNIAARS